MDEKSDRILIIGLKYGDEKCFEELFRKYYPRFRAFTYRRIHDPHHAEDILQNIYARFFQRISKKGYSDIENAEAFIISIAKFECKTFYAGQKKHSVTESFSDYSDEQMVMIENEMSKSQKNLEDVLCYEMLAREIFEDIANTDEITGKIFYLYFVCDMRLSDVAEELDMSLSAVKNKLYRTIERQKKKFRL